MLVHRRGEKRHYELQANVRGGRQNATGIHIDTEDGVLEFQEMRDVFVAWEPVAWKKDSWHGIGPSNAFICGVPECSAKAECMGFCKRHWTRVVRHGDYTDKTCSRLPNGLYTNRLREYKSWDMMKQRCYNKKYTSYKQYGARGITVCDRWLEKPNGFKNFLEDMGPRPDGTSLDRVDVNGNYTPENCRWANQSVQSFNRRPRNHSTRVTGVGKYFDKQGNAYFRGFISKNREFRQKDFVSFEDAVLWRAKQEQHLYGTRGMQFEKLIALVKDWGRQHKIDNPDKQLLHCYEELSEIGRLLLRGNYDREELVLEIGDAFITLIILADILGCDLHECVEKSLLKIQKRTGRTVDGNFLKDENA